MTVTVATGVALITDCPLIVNVAGFTHIATFEGAGGGSANFNIAPLENIR